MSDSAVTPSVTPGPLPQHGGEVRHSASFFGLLISHVLGVFNDNLLRWFAVPIAEPIIGLESSIALGGLCITLPYLLFMPIAGWMADRFEKRNVIVVFKIVELLLMGLAVLAVLYGSLWMLFVLVFLIGTQAALFGPAKFGSIPEMVSTHQLSKANGMIAMGSVVAAGLGSIISWLLFDFSHPVLAAGDWSTVWPVGSILITSGVLGVLTSLMIRTGVASAPERPFAWNPKAAIEPSLKMIWSDKQLLRATLGIAFFFLIASLAHQNMPRFVESVLLLRKADVGLLMGVLIVGVGAGSLLAGAWSDGKVELGLVPLGALGVVLSTLLICVSGLMMDPDVAAKHQFAFWGAGIGLLFMGIASGLYSVPLEAFLQYRSDPKQRGTILAGSFFLTYVFIVISLGVFYLLSETLNLSGNFVFLATGLLTIPVFVYSLRLLPDWTFRFCMWLAVRTFYKVRIHGRHNIPETGPAVIVANHISFLDGVLLTTSCPRFIRFLIYTDFTELPVLKTLGRVMRVIPIKPADGPAALVRSIRVARDALKNGEIVAIFPEGGLSRNGQLQEFQRGLDKITQGATVPILPVYLHGLWGSIFSWREGKVFWKWPRQWVRSIDLHFGEPLTSPQDPANVRLAVERLGAEAATMNATTREPIPVRQFIRRCKADRKINKVVDSTNVKLSGGKLLTGALALRSALRREVLAAGEKQVGVLLPPSVGGCLANMALALDSRTSVNLNYTLSEDVIQYCVKAAGIKHILTSRKFLEKKPYHVEGAEFVFLEDLKTKISTLDKLVAAFHAYVTPASMLERLLGVHRISADEPLTIIFTSGSTGEPKGVVLSHSNVGSNINAVDQILNLKTEDGMLGVLPFFHSFGYTVCLWLPMCYRLRGIYHFNPLDAKVVGRMVEEHHATIMMATPTFLKMYMRRCEKEQFKSVDLIVVGAEKLPVDLARQFEEKFGILPTEGYGTTELSPVVACNIPDHRSAAVTQIGTKLGTVGRPLPGVTAKVVDPETFEDRGVEKEGLLLIKGPNVMRGYLNEPKKTSEMIRDGWYNTGDFAILDRDGFVQITGRQSRFSKIGGEMVPHIRIEQELLKICEPADQDEVMVTLAVSAVPDEDRGERIIVLYTSLCKPVSQIIRELAASGLPKLWIPGSDSFIQVEAIPLLGTGKMDLRGIKELALQSTFEGVSS